jgi:uncharacterized protein YabN with tetrapyrrole methylase and pyrophosphatase domain
VVGTGIRSIGQLTLEAVNVIRAADVVLHLVTDPFTTGRLTDLNPNSRSLRGSYTDGRPRMEAYEEMIGQTLAELEAGRNVAAAYYGHPGVFAFPPHESIRVARERGYISRMLPGISAEDCLVAELGVDPAADGLQSYEATDFIVSRRSIDAKVPLILWQAGLVGHREFDSVGYENRGFSRLRDILVDLYGPEHLVTVYQAGVLPLEEAAIRTLSLLEIERQDVSAMATLYIPPLSRADRDMALLDKH